MEFILELIFEIIIEGSLELSTSKKVPMPLRILATIVCLLIYGGILGVIFMVGYGAMEEKSVAVGVFFFALGIALFLYCTYVIIKKWKQ